MRFNGTQWQQSATGSSRDLLAIWGSASNDIWVAEQYGDLLHYTGSGWERVEVHILGDMNDVFGFAADDVWAVSRYGDAYHYDGVEWTQYDTPSSGDLLAVWGAAPDDVWAVGDYGSVVHWDGVEWTGEEISDYHNLRDVGGTGANDVWVVGRNGEMYRNDGSGWWKQANSLTVLGVDIDAVAGAGAGKLWAATSAGAIFEYDGVDWFLHGFLDERDAVVTDVWVAGADDAWAVASEGVVLHYDGDRWSFKGRNLAGSLEAIHGTGPQAVWAIGSELLVYDGTSWESVAQVQPGDDDSAFVGVFGSGPNRIQALRADGTLFDWNGTDLSEMFTLGQYMTYTEARWTGYDDLWAVGYGGEIVHWDGMDITRPEVMTTNTLSSIWIGAGGDMFAAGFSGTILHKPAE
jgi:hypothetical protein